MPRLTAPPPRDYWSRNPSGAWHAFEASEHISRCGHIQDGPLEETTSDDAPPKGDRICGHCERHVGIRRYRTYTDALRMMREKLQEIVYEIDEELARRS